MIKQIRSGRIIIIQDLHFICDHIQYRWYKDLDDFNQRTSGQEINTTKKSVQNLTGFDISIVFNYVPLRFLWEDSNLTLTSIIVFRHVYNTQIY